MQGMLDLEALRRLVREGEIDTVLVCFPDLQGRLLGTRVAADYYLEQVHEETHACDYLLAADIDMEPVPGYKAASWEKGYGDFVIKPDGATLRRVPWLEGTALVMADVCDHHGELLPHAPRSVLKRQLARLAERGWKSMKGSELEFYLFDETYKTAHEKDYKNLDHAGWYISDYHIFQTTKEEPIIRAIRLGMEGAGIPVEVSKGEWGPGQEEINFRYCDALAMADNHSIYKNGAKEIAWARDRAITFMAKYRTDLAGSSCHIHSSLWKADGSAALFDGPGGSPEGMPDLFKQYIAGNLALAEEMTYFFAPYINSYKRFQAGSFAPTKAAWSFDNRTAGFRVVGHGKGQRVECRIPGSDCNPYLAFAVMIAAGLHGIDKGLELPPPFTGNAYESKEVPDVAHTLRDALSALERSEVLREALGDDVVEHYLHTGRWEQAEFDRRVTDLEVTRLFERI